MNVRLFTILKAPFPSTFRQGSLHVRIHSQRLRGKLDDAIANFIRVWREQE